MCINTFREYSKPFRIKHIYRHYGSSVEYIYRARLLFVQACIYYKFIKKLKEYYPDFHFIPIYWMASEDHDFEEISCFNMFGNKYQWATKQTGAVGRFDPSSLGDVINQISEKVELFEKAYGEFQTLADSVRFYVNELFGSEGLVVVDGDDSQLKAQFAAVTKDDILNQNAHQRVNETNKQLID